MASTGFREIADHLRGLLASGKLGTVGTPLPSETRLAADRQAARQTVRRALALLEAEGLVYVIPGRGRFVGPVASSSAPRTGARFERVAAILREEIGATSADPGPVNHRLGSEAALAKRFEVSEGTVRQALQQLAREGLVTAVHGRGWYVTGSGTPLTRTDEVADRIRTAITSGEIVVYSNLPGEAVLAEHYGVARITVRRALAKLESEGLIEKKTGRGRVVMGRYSREPRKGDGK